MGPRATDQRAHALRRHCLVLLIIIPNVEHMKSYWLYYHHLLQDNYSDINEPFHPLMALNLFEDIKGVIKIYKLNKNIQHNGQKKKYKRKNNDLQNICIKLKID